MNDRLEPRIRILLGSSIAIGPGKAALLEGILTEVPTLCLDHLTPEQARAFRIADNRLTEISTWDDRLLAEQLKELPLVGLDFNIEVTGFEIGLSSARARLAK